MHCTVQVKGMSSSPRRSVCPIACALDLLGDRWTLLVVRDLFLGRRFFDEFLASPEGIATNILADRLAHLVDHGLAAREPDAADRRRVCYRLTAAGRSLRPVLLAVKKWGLAAIPGTEARLAAK